MSNSLLVGWKAIAEFFGVSESKMKSYREELQSGGWIFYRLEGRPAQKRVCAWPGMLQRWIAIKTARGEIL